VRFKACIPDIKAETVEYVREGPRAPEPAAAPPSLTAPRAVPGPGGGDH